MSGSLSASSSSPPRTPRGLARHSAAAASALASTCTACRPLVAALVSETVQLRSELEVATAASNLEALSSLDLDAHGGFSASGTVVPRAVRQRVAPATLSDGTVLSSMRPEELAAMREVFALMDDDADGRISREDLVHFHAKLGEPLTDEEARDAVFSIGAGHDTISFDELATYWAGTHPVLRRGYVEEGFEGEALIAERRKKREWYR